MVLVFTVSVLTVSIGALAACSTDACEDRRDCPAGQACVQGSCELDIRRGGGGPPFDAGPRPDAGSIVVGGGGSGRDAGSGDASIINVGADSRGVVRIAELNDGLGSRFTTEARFVDEAAASFSENTQTFQTPDGEMCTMTTRRLTGGMVTGYDADTITVAATSRPGAALILRPRGAGVFTPDVSPQGSFFAETGSVDVEISPTASLNSLLAQTVRLSVPQQLQPVSPLPGTPVVIDALALFRWLGASSPATVTVEVYDRAREVVLSCFVADDGQFALPPAAGRAFLDAEPSAPLTVELRRDVEVTEPVSVRSGAQFSAAFRLSWGVRYPAQ